MLNCYQIYEEGQHHSVPSWSSIVFNFTALDNTSLRNMGLPSKYTSGYTFGTFVVDQKYYMKYITDRLVSSGVVFEQKRLSGFDELSSSGFDCIVNCSGLGAVSVSSDHSMYPIRGQVLRVK